jgi:hypothetical protein
MSCLRYLCLFMGGLMSCLRYLWLFMGGLMSCLRSLCLFVGGIMSCLRSLCLFAYSGDRVQCIFDFVCLRLVYHVFPVSLDYPFLIAPSVFSNVHLKVLGGKNTKRV